MAVPKKKTSKSVRNMRRSHDGLRAVAFGFCVSCKEGPIRPHHICSFCGHYDKREVYEVKSSPLT
ncbi:MAG: 50S ribosomal protein L32 [Alphaproteobacteria bacterium]|nr:50S ribosomal protein L32 [Alphaproteobacteria bacterium]